MKKTIKIEKEKIIEKPISDPVPSEDEMDLAELITIRDGLTKWRISTDSRLGILIDELQRKLQSH